MKCFKLDVIVQALQNEFYSFDVCGVWDAKDRLFFTKKSKFLFIIWYSLIRDIKVEQHELLFSWLSCKLQSNQILSLIEFMLCTKRALKSNICKWKIRLFSRECACSPIHCFQVRVPYQIAFENRCNLPTPKNTIRQTSKRLEFFGWHLEWQRTHKIDWYEISEFMNIFMVSNSSIQWLIIHFKPNEINLHFRWPLTSHTSRIYWPQMHLHSFHLNEAN